MRIPVPVIAVVADVLASRYTHSRIDYFLYSAGLEGDPPPGNKVEKVRFWLRKANSDELTDPLAILGRVLNEFMEVDAVYGTQSLLDNERAKVQRVLSEQGLTYVKGGRVVPSGVTDLGAIDSKNRDTPRDIHEKPPAPHRGLSIFISHSSTDAVLALALIDLIKDGLGLLADQIRCSSVDGYRLPVGVNTEGKLREEVNAAKVVVGLVTPSSLVSYYVMFELGARWGANLFLAPLLAGVRASELTGPLGLLNALSAGSESQLHQLIGDISKQLGVPVQPPASYVRHVSAVKALVDAIPNAATAKPQVTSPVKEKLRMTLSVQGTPPSQILKVVANRYVNVSRVEYMLSSEASLAGEDVVLDGATIETPVNDGSVLTLWNTPRADRNNYDHSGPAKIALTVSADGETNQYILPVQMEAMMQNNTMYRKLVGSKTFYS